MAIYTYPPVPVEPFELAVAKGNVPNHSVVNIFGYNTTVGTSFIPLWELNTAYTYPTSAVQMSVVSTSGSDTSVTIIIQGLDGNHDILNEVVVVNGTTPVTTTGTFYRINGVVTTSGNAVGDVTISNGGTTYAKMMAGTGRNQAALYTVPRGYNFYLYRLEAHSATATGSEYLTFRNYVNGQTDASYRVGQTTFNNDLQIQRRVPFQYGPMSDIQLQGKSSSSSNELGVFGEGILVKDG